MRAETRHQLKQDRFSRATMEAAEKTVHWSVEHKSKLIIAAVVVLVLAVAALGGWYYLNQRDLEASAALSQAVRTINTPVRPAGSPPQPDSPSFASSKERATEAGKQLQALIEKYPHTRSAEIARYMMALTAVDLGDNAAAERDLKTVAASRNKDLSALADLALGSVYRRQNRAKDAIELYKKLAEKPTRTVAKTTAQLEMAATYLEDHQPLEAKRIYEQVQKENPATDAARIAAQKLQQMK